MSASQVPTTRLSASDPIWSYWGLDCCVCRLLEIYYAHTCTHMCKNIHTYSCTKVVLHAILSIYTHTDAHTWSCMNIWTCMYRVGEANILLFVAKTHASVQATLRKEVWSWWWFTRELLTFCAFSGIILLFYFYFNERR